MYEHRDVVCQLNETAACFDKMSSEGWDYLFSAVIPIGKQSLTSAAPVVLPHVFSVWRKETQAK